MLLYILRRLAVAVPMVLAIVFIVFVVARLAPASPIDIILGGKGTPQARRALEHAYGLDRPILVQFGAYLVGLLHGDLGRSFVHGQEPVSRIFARDFPVTAQLALQAFLFTFLVGVPAGLLAAYYHNSWFDRALMAVVVLLVSVPSFVLGPLLVLFIAVRLGWLPVSGWDTPASTILPTVTLGARSAALVARMMRSSLLEVLQQDYIRVALAKGLTRAQAVWRHGLKNAFLPVLTVLGTTLGYLLTGSFVVETIFQVPGIGYESVRSISARDYPIIQATALFVALIFVAVNLLVDILYGWFDSRARLTGGASQ
ncbi:MAG TPA: ABC transporter permease [Chthonomonas sp.]|uniref:ABC transporter permease n=1 Tax=Chthonomonas sp. TaxID=2282153 RepID=UPI002B4AD3E0|nr:ABC transporter permease [Chthonomonas sp.]HLI47711.1 ABC transporter permease [Chthonomonas sp.]